MTVVYHLPRNAETSSPHASTGIIGPGTIRAAADTETGTETDTEGTFGSTLPRSAAEEYDRRRERFLHLLARRDYDDNAYGLYDATGFPACYPMMGAPPNYFSLRHHYTPEPVEPAEYITIPQNTIPYQGPVAGPITADRQSTFPEDAAGESICAETSFNTPIDAGNGDGRVTPESHRITAFPISHCAEVTPAGRHINVDPVGRLSEVVSARRRPRTYTGTRSHRTHASPGRRRTDASPASHRTQQAPASSRIIAFPNSRRAEVIPAGRHINVAPVGRRTRWIPQGVGPARAPEATVRMHLPQATAFRKPPQAAALGRLPQVGAGHGRLPQSAAFG